jgi:hypothetical protein
VSNLICGVYHYDTTARSLEQAFTCQSIRLTRQTEAGGLWFEYADSEITLSFVVEKTAQLGRSVALLDFNRLECCAIKTSYGLWRRATFFLLDSLPVWFFLTKGENEHFWRLDIFGGWANARWSDSAIIQAVLLTPAYADLKSSCYATPYPLAALHVDPIPWEYFGNLQPQLDFVLQYDPSVSGAAPVLSRSAAIHSQLRRVPFFSKADDSAFLYHRYVQGDLHRGESYAATPYYGYVDEHRGFTIRAHYYYGVDSFSEPVLRSGNADFNEHFRTSYKSGQHWSVDLTAPVGEELFFALLDINALWSSDQRQRPIIAARDDAKLRFWVKTEPQLIPRQTGVQFGAYLHTISGLPITNALGMACIAFGHRHGFPIAPRNLLAES